MKKNVVWKILIIVILVALIALLGIILWVNSTIAKLTESSSESNVDYRYQFSMVVDSYNNPYWDLVYDGAVSKALEQQVVVDAAGGDLSEDYSLSDRLWMSINSDVDGIFVVPDGSEMVHSLISISTSEGYDIPVLTMMENDNTSGRSGYVGINSYEQGLAYGGLIGQISKEQQIKNVVLLKSSTHDNVESRSFSSDLIYSSIIEYLNEHSLQDEIDVTVFPVNTSSVFNTRRDIQRLLSEDNAPDVIICADYLFTINTCQITVDKNMVGKVKILGSYISEDILDYIQKGTLYGTVAVDPYELGEICVTEMIELMEIGRTNDYRPIEMFTIDKSNVHEYIQKFVEGPQDEN